MCLVFLCLAFLCPLYFTLSLLPAGLNGFFDDCGLDAFEDFDLSNSLHEDKAVFSGEEFFIMFHVAEYTCCLYSLNMLRQSDQ